MLCQHLAALRELHSSYCISMALEDFYTGSQPEGWVTILYIIPFIHKVSIHLRPEELRVVRVVGLARQRVDGVDHHLSGSRGGGRRGVTLRVSRQIQHLPDHAHDACGLQLLNLLTCRGVGYRAPLGILYRYCIGYRGRTTNLFNRRNVPHSLIIRPCTLYPIPQQQGILDHQSHAFHAIRLNSNSHPGNVCLCIWTGAD